MGVVMAEENPTMEMNEKSRHAQQLTQYNEQGFFLR